MLGLAVPQFLVSGGLDGETAICLPENSSFVKASRGVVGHIGRSGSIKRDCEAGHLRFNQVRAEAEYIQVDLSMRVSCCFLKIKLKLKLFYK